MTIVRKLIFGYSGIGQRVRWSRTVPLRLRNSPIAMSSLPTYTVSPTELHEALKSQNSDPNPQSCRRIVPISAEWFLPNDPLGRKGYEEFVKLRIPGARFFDLDEVKDRDSPYPHMLPAGEVFAEAMGKIGIKREDTVVLYDSPSLGLFSAPRAAWTFRVFGHPHVHILDNFKTYIESCLPTTSGPPTDPISQTDYPIVEPNFDLISTFEEIKSIAESEQNGNTIQIIDARPGGRWSGKDPEPRPGLSSGHVPKSISVPFTNLIDPETKKLKPREELEEILLAAGVNPSEKVEKRLMCGTGVTAVVVDLALEQAGIKGKRKVYDGSWTEWAQRVDEKSGLIAKS